MKNRKFHIWNFPRDDIYICLEEDFNKKFFDSLKNEFGSFPKFADSMDVTLQSILAWRDRSSACPLGKTLKLLEYLENKGYDFTKRGLEKNITVYKGLSNSLKIKAKLPIVEDERMIRILFHLIGDGFAGSEKGVSGSPFYRNTSQSLLDNFENDLQVLGEVPTNRYRTRIQFPKVISYLMKHFYRIDFGTHDSVIPKCIYELPRNLVAQGIQAFIDDEGGIEDNRIKITSYNKKMLNQLKELIQSKFPTIGKCLSQIQTKNTELKGKLYEGYQFSILSGSLEKYIEDVGSRHEEKISLLENFLKRKDRDWRSRNKGSTKLLILQALRDRQRNVKEILKIVGITTAAVRAHMKGSESSGIPSLEKNGFVREVGTGGYDAKVWGITEKGSRFLDKNEYKIKYLLEDYSIDKFYLNSIKDLDKPVTSSNLAKKMDIERSQVQQKLLNLYRKELLERKKHEKNRYEFEYELTGKGVKEIKD